MTVMINIKYYNFSRTDKNFGFKSDYGLIYQHKGLVGRTASNTNKI